MHFVLLPTSDYRILSLKRYFWIVYVLVFIVASESSSPFIIEIIRFSGSSHEAYTIRIHVKAAAGAADCHNDLTKTLYLNDLEVSVTRHSNQFKFKKYPLLSICNY